ncbi:hypothetical protein BpHYR1_038252 [Brachionus plicatilis]|uniref:Uncharacterized protein n=1 Tax=Brachionus plicatilis TaxID=10195 RepID=A0A3M7QK81_BRAPC|nr:hypothetical protein BpHYR1_038252 [Brachionus plicatilis]
MIWFIDKSLEHFNKLNFLNICKKLGLGKKESQTKKFSFHMNIFSYQINYDCVHWVFTTLKREQRGEKTKHIGDVNALQNAVAERTPLALILRFS